MINVKIFKIYFWNGPGQERLKRWGDRFMKDSDILINICLWYYKKKFIFRFKMVYGNKSDLYFMEEVKEIEVILFVKSYEFKFLLTSGRNCREEFNDFLNQIIFEE